MIRFLLAAFSILAVAGVTTATHADTLAGRCFESAAATLNGKVVGDHKLSCSKGTWSKLGDGSDTGDVNGFVTIYNWEGKTTDNKIKVLFRPRKASECLVAVTQKSQAPQTFNSSHNCETDYKQDKSLNVVSDGTNHSVSGKLSTTSKANNFTAVYKRGSEMGKAGDNTLYLVGLFVEDK